MALIFHCSIDETNVNSRGRGLRAEQFGPVHGATKIAMAGSCHTIAAPFSLAQVCIGGQNRCSIRHLSGVGDRVGACVHRGAAP